MTVPFVRAEGSPYEVGYRHGRTRAEALRGFLADGLARINYLAPSPKSLESLRPVLRAYRAGITNAAPRLAAEIDGLADGASISRDEAVLLQARREIIGYQVVPARGDCTTYLAESAHLAESARGRWRHRPRLLGSMAPTTTGGGPVLAQTVDLNGNLDDQIAVLDIGLSGSGRRALLLSFGGLLGYLGLNSNGLAIGLNLVLGGRWRPGLPPYLAIRHLLDNADSVAAAVDLLGSLRLASSRSLMLCDASGATACVEILGDEVRQVSGRVHTNHFLHPDFVTRDQLNVFARNSSMLRLRTATAALGDLGSEADVEQHFGLLSTAPIRVADSGDIRRERTVAAVVLDPVRRELHLRPGDPAASATQTFRLVEAAVQ
jgi:isopenicillin-N N-acyltransferase-like protein